MESHVVSNYEIFIKNILFDSGFDIHVAIYKFVSYKYVGASKSSQNSAFRLL
jgi:hypothetical protein